ncbi:hypothetical protein RIF29_02063 [Crotalaria pallida]|uniref:Uncharacterized protein n=1 Tax=Crotalaria pallida TaxID=3830 RepID=A0AAN9IY25_CROPI
MPSLQPSLDFDLLSCVFSVDLWERAFNDACERHYGFPHFCTWQTHVSASSKQNITSKLGLILACYACRERLALSATISLGFGCQSNSHIGNADSSKRIIGYSFQPSSHGHIICHHISIVDVCDIWQGIRIIVSISIFTFQKGGLCFIFERVIWCPSLGLLLPPLLLKLLLTSVSLAFNDACERLCPLRGGGHECGCLPVIARLFHFPEGAFNDACERLCPLRGGGHECGCLPVIARLVL